MHENLLMGAFHRRDSSAVATEIDGIYQRFPNLASRRAPRRRPFYSGGEQQMLAIGRGLLAAPKVMMLDEPSLGLSPLLTNEVFALIATLNRENGLSILLVEQNIHRALELANRAYVLELGRVAMEGPSERILADRTLQDAYLGQSRRCRGQLGAWNSGEVSCDELELTRESLKQRRSTMQSRLMGAIVAARLPRYGRAVPPRRKSCSATCPRAQGPTRRSPRPMKSPPRSRSTRSTQLAVSPARSFGSCHSIPQASPIRP